MGSGQEAFELAEEPAIADDLIADAARLGFKASQRLLTDWVAEGLLDHPTRRSLGKGRGSTKALWPVEQRNLFRLLAAVRSSSTSIRPLQEVVIHLWVTSPPSERHWIPAPQAARALRKWAKPVTRSAAKEHAAQVLEIFGRPHGQAAGRLVNYLADYLYFDTRDEAALVAELRDAYSQERSQPYGRIIADRLATPESYARYLTVRIRGLQRAGTISEQELEAARMLYLTTHSAYQAARATIGPGYEGVPPDRLAANDMMRPSDVVRDLVTAIGLPELTSGDQQDP